MLFSRRLWVVAAFSAIGAWDAAAAARGTPPETVLRTTYYSTIDAIAISPDGKTIATCERGSQRDGIPSGVFVWSTATGKLIRKVEGIEYFQSVAFLDDGKLLATCTRTIGFYDQFNRPLPRGKPFGIDRVPKVSSRDGGTLVLGPSPGELELWDVASGKRVAVLPGLALTTNASAITRDGQTLAGVGTDTSIYRRDMATQAELPRLDAHEHSPRIRGSQNLISVAWSPDGKVIVSGGADNIVRLWDCGTGKVRGILRGHTSAVNVVAWAPDGKTLISGGWDTVRVWDLGSMRELWNARTQQVAISAIALSADGKTFVSGGYDKIVVWDLASGKALTSIDRRPAVIEEGGRAMWSVGFSPDGRLVATGGGARTRHESDWGGEVWDVSSGQRVNRWKWERPPWVTAFMPDERTVLTTGYDGILSFYGTSGNRISFSNAGAPYCSVAFSPDGKLMALGGGGAWNKPGGALALWHVDALVEMAKLEGHGGRVNSVAFSPDGKTLASAGGEGDQTIRLWNVQTREPICTLEGHSQEVSCVAWSPDGKTLASCGKDMTVRLWDVATQEELCRLDEHSEWAYGVVWLADGKTLVSAGWDTIRVWDVAQGKELRNFNGRQTHVTAVALSPDGKRLAAAGNEDFVVWDVATWQPMMKVERPPAAKVQWNGLPAGPAALGTTGSGGSGSSTSTATRFTRTGVASTAVGVILMVAVMLAAAWWHRTRGDKA